MPVGSLVRPADMHPSFSGVPLSLWRADSMQSRNVSSSLLPQIENPGMEMPAKPGPGFSSYVPLQRKRECTLLGTPSPVVRSKLTGSLGLSWEPSFT
jgi:hypothetical protein